VLPQVLARFPVRLRMRTASYESGRAAGRAGLGGSGEARRPPSRRASVAARSAWSKARLAVKLRSDAYAASLAVALPSHLREEVNAASAAAAADNSSAIMSTIVAQQRSEEAKAATGDFLASMTSLSFDDDDDDDDDELLPMSDLDLLADFDVDC